jgi:hypothetical protein
VSDLEFSPSLSPGPKTVLIDTPCRKCQYNLRSLSLQGLCPECATPVSLSVGDLLLYSDPAWLHKLCAGINFILITILIGIAGIILDVIASAISHSTVPSILVAFACGVLFFIGCWFLTAPDPSGLGEDQYGTSRRIVRIALLIGVVDNVISLAPQTQTIRRAVPSFVTLFAALTYDLCCCCPLRHAELPE